MRYCLIVAASLLLGACADASPAFRAAACDLPDLPVTSEQDRQFVAKRAGAVMRDFEGKPLARDDMALFSLVATLPTLAAVQPGRDFTSGPPISLGNGVVLPQNLAGALRQIQVVCDAQ